MTRRDFETIAWSLRRVHADHVATLPLESDERWAADRTWDRTVLAMADALAGTGPAFRRDLFLRAAGYAHRPDGSMVPVAWTASGRLAGYR